MAKYQIGTHEEIGDVMHELHQAIQKRVMGARLPSEQLTLQQLRALHIIRQQSGMTMGDLAEALGITKASTNALTNRLVRDGWASRNQDKKDRRISRISLSKSAETKIQRTIDQKRTIIRQAFSHLPTTDQKHLHRILKRVIHDLKRP